MFKNMRKIKKGIKKMVCLLLMVTLLTPSSLFVFGNIPEVKASGGSEFEIDFILVQKLKLLQI